MNNNESSNLLPHQPSSISSSISSSSTTIFQSNKKIRRTNSSKGNSELGYYGQWLLSIPRDEIPFLIQTPEYTSFVEAFQNLERAHLKSIALENQSQEHHHHQYHHQYQHQHQQHQQQHQQQQQEAHEYYAESTNTAVTPSSSSPSSSPTSPPTTTPSPYNYCIMGAKSFLQQMALDDIILRIFEFLPCQTLVKVSETCHRFHLLSKRSAKQRTITMEGQYYLGSEMKLLRAKEQIEGIKPHSKPLVRIPLLGLPRRIYVSGCGDHEFNGVYFCTGSNGNGFLFTKPREGETWSHQDLIAIDAIDAIEQHQHDRQNNNNIDNLNVNIDNHNHDHNGENHDNGNGAIHHEIEDVAPRIQIQNEGFGQRTSVINQERQEAHPFFYPGRIPRCIIGKRFSNEDILWYMSKETIDQDGRIRQMFSFWAKLMVTGEATPDICRYPSQTSILSRNGDPAWQSLTSTRTTTPPVVELLD